MITLPKYTNDGHLYPNSDFKTDTYYRSVNLSDARKIGGNVYLNSIRRTNNSKPALMKKGYHFLRDIFREYWEPFKNEYHHLLTRKSIIENVEKFVNCENFDKGFLMYKCPNGCGFHYQGFTCKSRFCPKCGKKYRDQRVVNISSKLIDAPHRQFVFTIPEEYRYYFQKYRSLLNVLFKSVNESFNLLMKNNKGIAKKEHRKLGFITFLHTYGRDMKWNPHLHVLIAERYVNIYNEIKKNDYFHYDQIRRSYMFYLTNNVYNHMKTCSSKKDLTNLYFLNKKLKGQYDKGFYVHGPKLKNHSISSVKAIANYIARYGSHPAISERRIIEVDKVNHTVTWFYDPHEDDDIQDESLKKGRQYITEHVFEFIKRLIIHIPDKHFHQIRYFGFYSNKSKFQKQTSLFSSKQLKKMLYNTYWITNLINSFGYTHLLCDVCGQRMHLSLEDSYFPQKGGAGP